MTKEELLKGLTKEQIAKVEACKSQEEILSLAKDEGVELTDEQLRSVTGGGCNDEDEKKNHRKIDSKNGDPDPNDDPTKAGNPLINPF